MADSGGLLSAARCSLAAMLARASLLGALLVSLAGCAPETLDGTYTCFHPDKGHIGPNGKPDPCHYQDMDAGVDADADANIGADADAG
jgi:hypothetical protein